MFSSSFCCLLLALQLLIFIGYFLCASKYSGVQYIWQWQIPSSGISFSIAGLQGHILSSELLK